ncbi:IclR family transcriptional regulator [Saccharothrix australiensis]|uniref:IclR family transcriptional regulator n=1 Tax=Saccharothrix australiensis TaxID=2072 RepID=A0A495VZZ2_9PSEU|nr:helix-turn-helix domain-containing protein [Saccharothrix australiensis]RKT55011.1 IclR family transcriptional regulator [Saccharothrix australiensis]
MDHQPGNDHKHTGDGAGRSVLDGAFLLLEELTRVGEAGPTQLAAATGLPKATAHRLLDQLAALGAVQRKAGRYRMGARMFHLGAAWQPAPLLRTAALHPLRQLAATCPGASVNVGLPEAGRTLVVGSLRGEADELFPNGAGTVHPRESAPDRLWAAFTPDWPAPRRYTASEWKRMITKVRESGIVVDYEIDCAPEVAVVGAPVRAASGKVVAGVSASVLDKRQLPSIIMAVQYTANQVSANLAR